MLRALALCRRLCRLITVFVDSPCIRRSRFCLKVCRSDRRPSSTVRFLGLFSVHDPCTCQSLFGGPDFFVSFCGRSKCHVYVGRPRGRLV